jgi:hypothetical protein
MSEKSPLPKKIFVTRTRNDYMVCDESLERLSVFLYEDEPFEFGIYDQAEIRKAIKTKEIKIIED